MILSDICEFIVDCPHTTAEDEGQGYPLIRTPNIGKGRLLLEGVHRVSEEVYNNRNFRAVPQDDDLIFAREAPAGNVAIIKNGEKVCLGQRTVLIRPNKKLVNPNYLVYYLLTPQQQYKLLGTANGATVAHVNLPIIRNLHVQLPDIETQNKIAKTLSTYDDLIENNQKQIKLLEEAAQRLYKEWFVDFCFPGHENTPIIDGIPQGWAWKSILDNAVFKFVNSRVLPFEGERTYYATADVSRTNIVSSGEKITFDNKPSRAAIQPVPHSVWFARMSNSYKILNCFGENEWMVKSAILSSGFAGFSSKTEFYGFVYQTIASERFNDEKNRYATGATQVSLTNDGLSKINVLIPLESIIIRYSKLVEPLMHKAELLKNENFKLKEARDRLLPKLMSGELEV